MSATPHTPWTPDALAALVCADVVPALGCTEPIAIAYATSAAAQALGRTPQALRIECCGNVVKNAATVAVPHAGGRHGVHAAAALGALRGDASRGLECLTGVDESDLGDVDAFLADGCVTVHLVDGIAGLFIRATASADEDTATAELRDDHTRLAALSRNGVPLFTRDDAPATDAPQPTDLTVAEIARFADDVVFDEHPGLVATLRDQIARNEAVAEAGLSGEFGAAIGATLLDSDAPTPKTLARAYAAAGSDARMGGCGLPVMINSGSGNQGLTVSVPVIQYARTLGSSDDELMRALVVSNLVAIAIKSHIGKLSAFCGAVSASAAAGAGIARLYGLGVDAMGDIVTTTLGTCGGMICDGAKDSCASKISVALEGALSAVELARHGHRLAPDSGIVGHDVDETIRTVGVLARDGMRQTDRDVLQVVLSRQES